MGVSSTFVIAANGRFDHFIFVDSLRYSGPWMSRPTSCNPFTRNWCSSLAKNPPQREVHLLPPRNPTGIAEERR